MKKIYFLNYILFLLLFLIGCTSENNGKHEVLIEKPNGMKFLFIANTGMGSSNETKELQISSEGNFISGYRYIDGYFQPIIIPLEYGDKITIIMLDPRTTTTLENRITTKTQVLEKTEEIK